MFKYIDHIAISVKDIIKFIEFYEKNFGFKPYFKHDVPRVAEIENWPNGNSNSGYHFFLISDDFDADYEKLVNSRIPVIIDPSNTNTRVHSEQDWRIIFFNGSDNEHIEFRR